MSDLEKRVTAIEQRNAKVELNKKWETSLTRRLTITALTYFIVAFYLVLINKEQPFINALVPSIGYFLSTLLLHRVRQLWQKSAE